ncbi:MAG: glycosyltransferase family 2 protein [Acidobacteria bacterium]|nr:glycosyltransferase family 2 protein [Acidobacteriota bacterium]
MSSPLVSVVVVNYNRAQLLKECLESLQKQTYRDIELIIVDNGSTDHSNDIVRSVDDSRVHLTVLDSNTGFAAGCNHGIHLARGEWVALLNNDAVADPYWLEYLVKTASLSPRVGMCASKILIYRTNIIDKAGHLMYPDGQNRGRGTGEVDRGQYDKREEVFFPDGCAALYRKRLLEELGGFDESFFAYGDDADLGVRARWMGWICIYEPRAVVYHRHSSTAGAYSLQRVYWIERNRFWLAVKNFPVPILLLTPLFTLNRWHWNLWAALLMRGPAGNFRRSRSLRLLVRALILAYVDGLKGFPRNWSSRKRLRRKRRISDVEFYRLLIRFRVSARQLSFQDHSCFFTGSNAHGSVEQQAGVAQR